MKSLDIDVRECHVKFGTEAPATPVQAPDPSVMDARKKLITEEFDELMVELDARNMVGIISECIDLIYVCVGTLVVLGVPMMPFWKDIQRSNMDKEPAPDGGKWIKPSDWIPSNPKLVLHRLRQLARGQE